MNIGVCIRAKDEQQIICDWVLHYLKLGFDKIFIYDNMSEPSIESSLKSKNLLNDKIIIKIDTFPYSNQPVIYQECIDENKELDWLLLCDTDEFLWLKEGTIKDFLSKFSDDTCTVFINWLVYGTSNLKTYDRNKSVFEQFTIREEYSHFWNTFVKSFVRPKLIEKIGNVHTIYNNNYKVGNVYNNNIMIKYSNKCDYPDKNLNDNTPLVLVHYMTLDFESMQNKFKRNSKGHLGEADNWKGDTHKYSLKWYKMPVYGFNDNVKDLRMKKYIFKHIFIKMETYICNLTGNNFTIKDDDKGREGGSAFGLNSRLRSIIYVLTNTVLKSNQTLNNITPNKNIRGIGMSDAPNLALELSKKFNYVNTFYHTDPFLDIYNNEDVSTYNNLDFIISSDVFEHISPYPNVQTAFNNLFKMLKIGGHIIFSVPFIYDNYYEHFPSLYDYSVEFDKRMNKYYIKNITIDGKEELFYTSKTPSGQTSDLCFHEGPGSTLEMRIFSQDKLIKYLKDAGFREIIFYDPNEIKDMEKYGIFWENKCSLVLSAKKCINIMQTIYFIINQHGNHESIIKNGGGASEVLFYLTAHSLSKYFNVIVYNRDSTPCKIDGVEYRFLPNNMNPDIENINNSVVIVQRHFNMLIDLHKINPSNKYTLWSHDYLEKEFNNLSGKYKSLEINRYFSKHNIQIVSVSHFHKSNILSRLPDVNVNPIYNALFSEYFIKQNDINYDKNTIIFASNWAKGLNKVLNIGEHYYKLNKDFKLILIKPKYCDWEPDLQQYPFIEKLGCIENKNEYCKLLQSCLCVFSTSYPETFGCVFAEALHLGVPVIGDSSVEAGFHEIIPSQFICNFNKPNEVISKIENIRIHRPNVSLDSKFYSESIINEWVKILKYLTADNL